MQVAELFAKLGLELDENAWAKGALALTGLHAGLELAKEAYEKLLAPMIEATDEIRKQGVEVFRTAQKVGIGTAALQELTSAAEGTGVSAEALQTGLRLLSRSAFEASHGSAEAGQAFRLLGVGVTGANGQLKPTDELLSQLADKFAKMSDGPRKTALAMKLFGRSGAELIPLLNRGSDAIEEMRAKARELGIVMDDALIGRAREATENQRELHEALEGLKLSILGPLLGTQEWKKKLAELISQFSRWIRENKVVERTLGVLGSTLRAIYNATKLLAETWRTWLIPAILAATLAWGPFIAATLEAAATAIAAWTAAAAPFVAWGLAIAAVILLLDDLENWLEGNDSVIGRHAGSILHWFESWLGPLTDIPKMLKDISEWLDKVFSKAAFIDKLKSIGAFFSGPGALAAQSADMTARQYAKDHSGLTATAPPPPPGIAAPQYIPAAAGAGNVHAPMSLSVTVHAPTGDGYDIANQIQRAWEEFGATQRRETLAAVSR